MPQDLDVMHNHELLLDPSGHSGNRESIEKKTSVRQVTKAGHNSSNKTLDIVLLPA